MSAVIKVENLSKSYLIGHQKRENYIALRDVMAHKLRGIAHRIRHPLSPNKETVQLEEFWALKDINLEIQQGDRIGIIGRNGAGKSTLLKILSRITEPTTGSIMLKGRVASLLEVGTGFHPELTGRENIFLNGAILGMAKKEIKRKFDEIVAFAEVEKFLDTPVKRYSSGMYVRLAFAVAAHLEPEILIVDEVLAVGDAQFQKKCLGKMQDIGTEGRTVLFVSHNMGTISKLCSKCILLNKGIISLAGNTIEVIDSYLEESQSQIEKIERDDTFLGNHFKSIFMSDESLVERMSYRFDEDIFIKISLVLSEFNFSLELAMRLIDKSKRAVFTIHDKLINYYDNNELINLIIKIPKKFLTPGRYSWIMCINHPGVRLYDLQDDALPFTVYETGSDFAQYEGADYGCVFANYSIRKI
jgi:lipopolysaccharide transport system ATP-binding protein